MLKEVKMKNLLFIVGGISLLIACSSTKQMNEDYFGYSTFPEREKRVKIQKSKVKHQHDYPTITSSQPLTESLKEAERSPIIVNNYYGPLHPRYYYPNNPYDFDLFFYFGDPFSLSYCNFPDIYVPYYQRNIYYIYPYNPFYWEHWYHRHIVYVPTKPEPDQPKTVRDFGPSRGKYDSEKSQTQTRQSRSSSRNNEVPKPSLKPDNDTQINSNPGEVVKIKLTEKSSNTSRKSSVKVSTSNTKRERSSTRPK